MASATATTPTATKTTPMNTTSLDLQVIDETFGAEADLYKDVLRVNITATQEEIQLAYFDRRSELFTLLAKIDATMKGPHSESSSSFVDQRRYQAEKRMDCVVFAVRVLANPALRTFYDEDIRPHRVGGRRMQRTFGTDSIPSRSQSQQQYRSNCSDDVQLKPQRQKQKHVAAVSSSLPSFPHQPRIVTPTELPSNNNNSSTRSSSSSNWVKSAFSGSFFSLGNDDDINDDINHTRSDKEETIADGDNNVSKNTATCNSNIINSPRRQNQQEQYHHSSPSSRHRPVGFDNDQNNRENQGDTSFVTMEDEQEEEKKSLASLWRRKKRKKKNKQQQQQQQQHETSHGDVDMMNQRIDSNIIDSSVADNENSSNGKKREGIINNFKQEAIHIFQRSSTSNTEYTEYTDNTYNDSTVQTNYDDDDTRTYDGEETFASMSVISNPDDAQLRHDYNKAKKMKKHGKNSKIASDTTCGKQGMFGCITGSTTFKKISDEISGACEDTLLSVDQVFNAFTLTDKDIKAVTKKIDKAKQQLET